jgi:conjugative transfer signal peptidase TraF
MRTVGVASLLVSASFCLLLWSGMRINGTHSFPVGIYWTVQRPMKKGDLVFVLPPAAPAFALAVARGYLERGYTPAHSCALIKRVVAIGGDLITIDVQGVSVNGERLPNSTPLEWDGADRPLQPWWVTDYRLDPREVLLMSDYSPLSWDSRYFGPLPITAIQSVIRPVLTWR